MDGRIIALDNVLQDGKTSFGFNLNPNLCMQLFLRVPKGKNLFPISKIKSFKNSF